MSLALSSMPEEILERILGHVVAPPSVEPAPRPAWHARPPACSSISTVQISPLLVNHAWLRVATPLHYRHVVLRTAHHTALLADTLRANPELGHWVRSVRIEGSFDAFADVAALCPNIEEFDMVVDNGSPAPAQAAADAVLDEQVARFCASFAHMRNVKHLVVRKNAYLTQARPTLVFEQLSKAIASWTGLETVNIAFRCSPSPGSSSFATSLAAAPNLRAVRALLPAIWNSTLLEISENPALKGIHLTPDTELIGAHLFLAEARKHTRLMELIHAGTPIARRRAQTVAASARPAHIAAPSVEARDTRNSRQAPAADKSGADAQAAAPSLTPLTGHLPRNVRYAARRLSR